MRIRGSIFVVALVAAFSSSLFAQKPKETPGAVPALPSDIPASAEHYSVVIMDNLAGQQAVWSADDGTHMFFQFNDRGRGPRTTSVLKLDSKGIPVAETVKGNDYLKSVVNETYSVENGTAHWKNGSEQGDKKLSAPSIYVPINPAPAEQALLVHVALNNGGKVALLPEGEAAVMRATALDIDSAGQKKHVVMYAVTGLDFSPTYVWLDDKDKYFASVSPWGSVIAEGWETSSKALQNAQDQVENSRAADLASKLAHHAEHGIAFTHANVFDANTATVIKDQTVVVSGNRIRAVGSSKDVKPPSGAEVIDANGKTLLPGLWDMHAHVGDNDGLLNLAAGVTTVRDLANDTDTLLARRKRIEEGKEIGTRIVIAGIIDGPGPYQGPTKVLVATEQEARAAVDNYKKLGYVQIKIYSSVKPSLVPAIIDEAHKNGLRVSGHIPAQMTAAQCVKLGYDEIQHANFLILNFLPDVEDTNTTKRFTEVGKRGADVDLTSPEVQSFVKLLLDHHTTLDPTLSAFEDMLTAGSGQIPRGFQPVASRLPSQVRRGLLSAGLTPPAGMSERYNLAFEKMTDMVGMLYRAGVPIEVGTDNMAGFALHRELELDVKAGIPPEKVLQNATLNAARIMSLDNELGSIASGKLADMTLVDGDPTEHISDIRKTSMVVKDGVLYKPAELYSSLGVRP